MLGEILSGLAIGVIKEVNGTEKPALETDLAGNKTLQDAVASNGTLKAALAKPADIAQVKALQDAVATQLLTGDNKTALVTEVTSQAALKTAIAADEGFRGAVTSTLAKPADIAQVKALQDAVAANTDLRTAVKGALASDTTFRGNVKIEVNSEEPGFQGAVRGVMSKPVFEIPTNENEPLSWDWI